MYCSIKNCLNKDSKSFFRYPSNFTMRKKWMEKTGLKVDPTNKVRICSDHFDNDCFKESDKKNRLRRNAVPSLFLDDGKKQMIYFYFMLC